MSTQIRVSANYDRWIAGFENLQGEFAAAGRRVWQGVTDTMFDRSQQYAHVLTGENKASGSADTVVESGALVGRITYDSDHAIYEEMRGGDHAYLARAFEATEEQFRRAFPQAWEAVVDSWR